MINCPKCGEEVPAGKNFCPECGEQVSRLERHTVDLRRTEDRFEEAIASTGRYKVKKLLGRGGMGLVYHAIDKELGIEVAIKSLPPELSGDARSLNQLRQEAKLSMQLTHQNIVRLYDLKEAQDSRLLVMEYIPGFSLSDYLFHREKLCEEEVWEILKPVASALDYAHSRKVIHRDIKPSNILFKTILSVQEVADYYQKEGKFPAEMEIRVADFGIARTVSDSISRLSNMPVSGTLTYMSSEQIRGKRQTHFTDVYSLAVVAYELLCGHPPFFQGEITYQIINEPAELIPGVKPEYMQAILKALSKNPEDRPQTCAEFIQLPEKLGKEKDQWALVPSAPAPEPAISPPAAPAAKQEPSPPAYPKAPAKKSRSRLFISLGVIALILILGPAGYFGVKYSKKPGSKTPEKKTETQPAPEPALKPVTEPALKPGVKPAPKPGAEPAPVPGKVELLWKAGKNSPDAHKGKVNSVSISLSQGLVASGGEDGSIKLWSLSNGALLKTLKAHSLGVNSIAISPGGGILASGSRDSKIKLWRIPSGELIRTIDSGLGEIHSVCFGPEAKYLASASMNSIKLWNVSDGGLYKKLGGTFSSLGGTVAFSPKGRIVASGGTNYIIKLWDIESGKDIATLKGPMMATINSLSFSPGGSLLASAGTDKNVKLWDVPGEKLIRTLGSHQKSVSSLAFSPSGKIIASASADETIKLWRASGGLIQSIQAHPASSISLVGNYLASGGCPENEDASCQTGEVRLYKINW